MSRDPLLVYNRYTSRHEEEAIFGEGALRFAYENPLGRVLTRWIFARRLFSRIFGWMMKRPRSKRRIIPFVKKYQLQVGEFERSLEAFTSFNDFFTRRLKPEARPIVEDTKLVVFPADGRHLGWQSLADGHEIFIKGQQWNLPALLGQRKELVKTFAGGTLVLSRLCPVDYHHFHYPVAGRLLESCFLKGLLYSVSPIALRRRAAILWENLRCLNLIETPTVGRVCFMEIGATNVGSIRQLPVPVNREIKKGERKGWFEFGGSSVLTLFEPGRVQLSEDLSEKTMEGIELYAHVGDTMGRILP